MKKIIWVFMFFFLVGNVFSDTMPERRPIESGDDGHERTQTSVVTITGNTWLSYAIGPSTYYGAYRFQNVTIPAGSTILTASISIYIFDASYDDIKTDLRGERIGNSPIITTGNLNISNRTRTTVYQNWTNTSAGVGWHTSPDISNLIQQIIDEGAWASGNALMIIGIPQANANCYTESWDSGNSLEAKFNCTYTPPVSGAYPQVIILE